tara:strand:+ start:1058 stop:1228 length:171 start_codon:yes stop_codon:yes gene_type:complete
MKVYVLKIGYDPVTEEVSFIKEYIDNAKAFLEIGGERIELDDELGDLVVSDEVGIT